MTIDELKKELATHLHDPALAQVTGAQWLIFINSAARDARNQGWYLHIEEDETLEFADNTYDYTVPANFALVDELWQENPTTSDVFDVFIYPHLWRLVFDGGVAKFRFDASVISDGANIKIMGQKRPSIYSADSDTIDVGMESFLRERALMYGARYLARGGSNFSRQYAALAQEGYVTSERLLHGNPQAFRMRPSARWVPGR